MFTFLRRGKKLYAYSPASVRGTYVVDGPNLAHIAADGAITRLETRPASAWTMPAFRVAVEIADSKR